MVGIPTKETYAILRKEQMDPTPITVEKDPNGIPAGVPGSKLDDGKIPVWQGLLDYFPRAIEDVARVSMLGANKYSWKGWEQVPDGVVRYRNAMARHITKEAIEGPWDVSSLLDPKISAKVRHLTQVAWNALAALELTLRQESSAQQGRVK